MIIQNKILHKFIDIDDYVEIIGKYKIVKKNGNGKEYKLNRENLIFEGEYLNGKRNGKGKEYYKNGDLMFEGVYKNGKRNEKLKEYNSNG